MLDLQENIAKAQSATAKRRRSAVDIATREYFGVVDLLGSPAASDFQAAEARAYAVLKQELLSREFVGLVDEAVGRGASAEGSGERGRSPHVDDDRVAMVALGFDGIAPALRIPGPVMIEQTKGFTLALAGAGGAVAGMLILAPLMRFAFENRELGMILGGPLGALVAVLVAHRLARIRFLTRVLPWVFVRRKSLRGAVRSEHEKAVRAAIGQWVDWAAPILAVLCLHVSAKPESQTDRDKALRRMSKLVYALHRASPESLPVVAHELIQEAKNDGFEGLEGQPAFLTPGMAEQETMVWKPDLQGKYETFGHIVEGDQVTVERPAVILGGQIVQRGLVRKVRERS
jgi:hypothetical protein